MSSENVEFVKRVEPNGVDLVEYFAESDLPAGEEDSGRFAENFEVRFIARGTATNELLGSGREGFVKAWRDWLLPWKSYRLYTEEIIDAGDAVVAFARVEAQTERDSVLVEHSPAAVWWFAEGRVAAIHFYLDRDEALAAVGLSEAVAEKSE